MMRTPGPLETIGTLLVVTGFLAYLLMEPGTTQRLIITFGLFGLGVLGMAFALRLIRDRPS